MQFTGQLYPFQTDVLKWIEGNDRGIIGLDMGLGKTVITIAMICQKHYNHTLIIVPLPIIEQWKASFLKFSTLKATDVCVYQGPKRKQLDLTAYPVVLTTYDTIRNDLVNKSSPLMLAASVDTFDCMVLDEAHKIRNKKTSTNKACHQIGDKITAKWLLTGTTIHNKFEDFYNLCVFTKLPDLSVDNLAQKEYRDRWYYRLTKVQSGLQLPAKSIHSHGLQLAEKHLAQYTDLYNETKETYEDYLVTNSKRLFSCLLVQILRLRQCCNHPDLALGTQSDDLASAKFIKAFEIIKDIPKTDKIIIFSQWEQTLSLFGCYLAQHQIEYLQYDGHLTMAERGQVLEQFKNTSMSVLLITIQTGGVGLDLNFANHVVILDSWWNHALEAQAIDRVYRIGQKKKVEIHQLYIQDTIEEWMLKMKHEKQLVDQRFHEESQIYTINKSLLRELLHRYI